MPEDVFKDTLEKVKDTHAHLSPEQQAVVAKGEWKYRVEKCCFVREVT